MPRPPLQRVCPPILLIGLTLACENSHNAPEPGPVLSQVTVAGNPTNALSARVHLDANGVDSLRIEYAIVPGGPPRTLAQPARAGRNDVLLLGLQADTSYSIRVTGYGPQGVSTTTPTVYHTDPLPAGLADLRMAITGTPPVGYTVAAVVPGDGNGYLVVFDSGGAVAWYRGFTLDAGELPTDIHRWPNGNYTLYLGASTGWQPVNGSHLEITPGGDVVREYRAPAPYYTDNHELRLAFSDTTLTSVELFGYDLRVTDLTAIGGASSTLLAGHQILRLTPNGSVDFFWNAWDHLQLTDWIETDALGQNPIDFDHPNSLDLAPDGNYLVSWRSLAEITKIHARTGRIIWRLGGKNNQFTFVNDPLQGFSAQHYARATAPDRILLFDNGNSHAVRETRIVEYQIDETGHTATLQWEYRHTPAYFVGSRGSVDRLASGNTFIGWATLGRVEEVTPDKAPLWEGAIQNNQGPVIFYRAFRTPSLYRYQVP